MNGNVGSKCTVRTSPPWLLVYSLLTRILVLHAVGPALEAFGFQRIIFGSSPSLASNAVSNAADWCELTRESFAELGVEQECIDAVFFGNANLLYGSS